ncbi:MAG: hypothetical protein A3D31_14645 [Candidatus Fluviicola riflensis]|nr:MAG: hypothetical protein CHH17_19080 [Candidatus Fluviicola riflensis]OGS78205.1 MAG: hypothetical protein A3D31_14645 [Candidatus Fluviicola riflensis]OGS85271.1 MAG: hypothetical protein A2724_11580 [Fluviicola sp. RIFCSPHIGHO2_01_FULL_43_53]OGS87313.1 MAG: hypothetical protein A3E30_08000 [Fluviicola sp. RIFCSPHIGHO2_12_FULL_43_24]
MMILQIAHGKENSTGMLQSEFMGDQQLLLTDQNKTVEQNPLRKNEPFCRGFTTGAETEKLYE